MASDFTRFDFHAKKFYFSENVRSMSAEEVGQYVLLMVEAWMSGKDTTLPDNPKLLASMARVEKVSDAVLDMFPVTETGAHGLRRRNETLYEEWVAAVERSESGRVRGQLGGLSRSDAKISAARENGKNGGRPVVLLSTQEENTETQAEPKQNPRETETRFVPYRTDSNHTVPSASAVVSSSKSDWKNIALRHKRIFGSKASVQFRDKYYEACAKYGEDVVLQCFDEWAPGAKDWVDANNVQNPLYSFFKKLPAEAEDAVEIVVAEKQEIAAAVEKKQQQVAAEEKSVAIQNKEIIEQFAVKPQTNTAVIDEDFFKE